MYSFLLCHWIYFSDHIYFQLGLQHTYFYCFFNVLLLWFLFLPFISLNTISSSQVHLGPDFPSVCPHFQCICDSPLWCFLHPPWGLLSVYPFFFFKVSSYSCDLSWEFHTSSAVWTALMRQFRFGFAEAWWVWSHQAKIHVNLLAWGSCIMQMVHIAWDLGHVSCISHTAKPRYCLLWHLALVILPLLLSSFIFFASGDFPFFQTCYVIIYYLLLLCCLTLSYDGVEKRGWSVQSATWLEMAKY